MSLIKNFFKKKHPIARAKAEQKKEVKKIAKPTIQKNFLHSSIGQNNTLSPTLKSEVKKSIVKPSPVAQLANKVKIAFTPAKTPVKSKKPTNATIKYAANTDMGKVAEPVVGGSDLDKAMNQRHFEASAGANGKFLIPVIGAGVIVYFLFFKSK